MAYYNYKYVRDQLPNFIIQDMGEDYEGEAGYDGDQWIAASNYIDHLEKQLLKLVPDYDFNQREGK